VPSQRIGKVVIRLSTASGGNAPRKEQLLSLNTNRDEAGTIDSQNYRNII
jgi:hypothetical protein